MFWKGTSVPFVSSPLLFRTYKISGGNRKVLYSLAILHALIVTVSTMLSYIPDRGLTRYPGAVVYELLRSP